MAIFSVCDLTWTVCRSGIPLYTDICGTVCLLPVVLLAELALLLLLLLLLLGVLWVLGVLVAVLVVRGVLVLVEELEVPALLALEAGGPCSPSIVPPRRLTFDPQLPRWHTLRKLNRMGNRVRMNKVMHLNQCLLHSIQLTTIQQITH